MCDLNLNMGLVNRENANIWSVNRQMTSRSIISDPSSIDGGSPTSLGIHLPNVDFGGRIPGQRIIKQNLSISSRNIKLDNKSKKVKKEDIFLFTELNQEMDMEVFEEMQAYKS